MRSTMPRTPFSTALSGSAKETEIRLKNIFSGPKKRPPLLFLVLIFSICVFCGNLVSCQVAGAELPPPDLSTAPVDWEHLSVLAPLYTREENGNVLIGGLGNTQAEWNRASSGSFLYFAEDPAFCCPSLAGRTAEGSAAWQDSSQEIISVDISIQDDRLESGTIDGFQIHFVADLSNRTIKESSFSSELGDGNLELSETEMIYAGQNLAQLMREAEWSAAANVAVLDAAPDLNRNGIPEELHLVELEGGLRLEVLENGTAIYSREGYYAHAGYTAVFLCTLDGEDYLLSYSPTMYQGDCGYGYELFTLENGVPTTVRQNSIAFDINFGHPIHHDFDPEAIAAFTEEINGLLAHSVQLLNTDDDLLRTFEATGRLVDNLWWLDTWKPVFARDEEKTLLENLVDFQDAMIRQAG